MAADSERSIMTPRGVGPSSDPALLGANGRNADGEESGVGMTLSALRKYQNELSSIPEETGPLIQSVLKHFNVEKMNEETEKKQKQLSELSNLLTETTDMEVPLKSLSETFVLSSILLITFSLSSIIGSIVLSPIVGLLIPVFGASLISAVALPIALGIEMRKNYRPIEALQTLLITTFVQGFLSGAAVSQLTLTGEPFVVLSPIVSAFTVASFSRTSRLSVLQIIAASSFGAHLLVGFIEGQLSLPYHLLTLFYTIAVAIPVQLSARDGSKSNINLYSVITVGLTIGSRLAIYGLLGANIPANNIATVSPVNNQ